MSTGWHFGSLALLCRVKFKHAHMFMCMKSPKPDLSSMWHTHKAFAIWDSTLAYTSWRGSLNLSSMQRKIRPLLSWHWGSSMIHSETIATITLPRPSCTLRFQIQHHSRICILGPLTAKTYQHSISILNERSSWIKELYSIGWHGFTGLANPTAEQPTSDASMAVQIKTSTPGALNC